MLLSSISCSACASKGRKKWNCRIESKLSRLESYEKMVLAFLIASCQRVKIGAILFFFSNSNNRYSNHAPHKSFYLVWGDVFEG